MSDGVGGAVCVNNEVICRCKQWPSFDACVHWVLLEYIYGVYRECGWHNFFVLGSIFDFVMMFGFS